MTAIDALGDQLTTKMRTVLKTNSRLNKLDDTSENRELVLSVRDSIILMKGTDSPPGVGDNFDAFCASRGRGRPTSEQIDELNADPYVGAQNIRKDASNPKLYRALCTFKARGGLTDVQPL